MNTKVFDEDVVVEVPVDISKAPPREVHDWDMVQLTKAERKGKTYEEMQAMRKDRWIEAHR